eukprot:gene25329-10985_t
MSGKLSDSPDLSDQTHDDVELGQALDDMWDDEDDDNLSQSINPLPEGDDADEEENEQEKHNKPQASSTKGAGDNGNSTEPSRSHHTAVSNSCSRGRTGEPSSSNLIEGIGSRDGRAGDPSNSSHLRDLGSSQERAGEPSNSDHLGGSGSSRLKPTAVNGSSSIENLSKEVLFRILSFLSTEDLMAASRCSSTLTMLASDDVLWRRHYMQRFGTGAANAVSGFWKLSYMSLDAEEFDQTVSGVPEDLKDLYIEMQRAKRQSVCRMCVDDYAPMPKCFVQQRLGEWRREKGFSEAQAQRPKLSRKGGVCPCSGMATRRMVTCYEEQQLRRENPEDEGDDYLGPTGALGKAWHDAYYCDSEKELLQKCGVAMR